MRQIVVSMAGGEIVTETEVEEHELVGAVGMLIRLLPDLSIYIDGQLVGDEARAVMKAAVSEGAATRMRQAALPELEPAKVKEYGETLRAAFEDIRRGQLQVLGDLRDHAVRFSEMWIERERQFADEAARQRELTRKSLSDVDLLGRSVKAVQLQEVMAMSTSNTARRANRGDGMSWMDVLAGVIRVLKNSK